MSKKRTGPKTDKNFKSLITVIKNSLETHLKEMLSKMFNDADEKLFELADSAISNEDQNRYFELMRNLREFKNDISTDFLINTKDLLKPFAEAEAKKKKEAESDGPGRNGRHGHGQAGGRRSCRKISRSHFTP